MRLPIAVLYVALLVQEHRQRHARCGHPNLRPFFSRGGKVLMYHGWNDQLISPRNSINYYTNVVKSVTDPIS